MSTLKARLCVVSVVLFAQQKKEREDNEVEKFKFIPQLSTAQSSAALKWDTKMQKVKTAEKKFRSISWLLAAAVGGTQSSGIYVLESVNIESR